MKKSIFIGVLNQGEIRPELSNCLTKMSEQTDYDIFMRYSSAKPIANNRNKMVQEFLAGSCDYMMMIDSDIVPPPTVLAFADFEKDIIAAKCYMYQQSMVAPVIFKRKSDGMYTPINAESSSGLIEVDAVGTGCIMLSRKVLEEIKAPFLNEYDQDGIKLWGLDIAFCRRAKEKGYKVYAHLDYDCCHWQPINLRIMYRAFLSHINKKNELIKQLEESNDPTNKTNNSKLGK